MSRIRRIFTRQKRKVLVYGLVFLVVGIKFVGHWLHPNLTLLTETHKCPACYGLSACDAVNNRIKVKHISVLALFSNLFGIKNVYYGEDEGREVVLKKLAHTWELEAFDEMLCSQPNLRYLCTQSSQSNENSVINVEDNLYANIINEVTYFAVNTDSGKFGLLVCPHSDNTERLFHSVFENGLNEENSTFHVHLWTLIKINPEPIILQILRAEDGWPVPKYLGACGRLIVEEYIGLPLISFYNEDWIRRASIASSLLNAVHMLTFRSTEFSFYLTDISPENIAVNCRDEAKFVDLEDMIIVDKKISIKDQPKDWKVVEVNKADPDCDNCFVFSPKEICSHYLSDHNYYALCKHLLAPETSTNFFPGGFLHDIPKQILKKYPILEYLLRKCAVPDQSYDRITFGKQLKELLDTVITEAGTTYRKSEKC
ncbi:deleted in autism protein 1 homolog [Orussus abietinus]|uniref:deleted in autism protein 1 homolog n=1 Tax=Orussus abietinus TaxID=222816 RepID=UPI0006254D8F|nr:deleted in autism protein 1 homolog [Orussus abietinus]